MASQVWYSQCTVNQWELKSTFKEAVAMEFKYKSASWLLMDLMSCRYAVTATILT